MLYIFFFLEFVVVQFFREINEVYVVGSKDSYRIWVFFKLNQSLDKIQVLLMYGCCYIFINIVESRQVLVVFRNIKKFVLKIIEQYKNGNNIYKLNLVFNFIK